MPSQIGWLVAAFAACLSVFAVNRGPLYYHDTIDYLNRGSQVLASLHVKGQPQIPGIAQHAKVEELVKAEPAGEKSADVSRSVVYAILLGLFAAASALEAVVIANAVVAVLMIWLVSRVVVREFPGPFAAAPLTFAAVVVGLAGSLGFYVAFLMPDIFAPALLLVGSILAGFAARMTGVELLVAVVLGSVAVVVHNSHIVIALLLVPVVLAGSLIAGGARKWLAPALMAVIAFVGVAQMQVLKLAVHKVEKADATYLPFLTARLIQDGPGRAYLAAHCPDPAITTCSLWTALGRSNDPRRFTASHITFERSDRLGSYRLMPADQQRAIAQGQVGFFLAVLRDRPLATAGAVATNVLRQLTMNSIDMTLPDAEIRGRMIGQPGLAFSSFDGRFTREDGWIAGFNSVQDVLYVVALAAVLALGVLPATPRRLRVFVWMVLAGIVVNALVCGAISQPATRYGARVIWLLPAVAIVAGGCVLRPASNRRKALLARTDVE